MAVDTRSKRMSLIGLGVPVPNVLPNPDTSIGQGDRLHFLQCYSGRTSFQINIGIFVAGVDVTDKALWRGFKITDSLGNIKGMTVEFKE